MEEILSALKRTLLEEYETFIPLIKCIANEKRMEIIILLLDGPKSFQFLISNTLLQKTALSNHLAQLIEVNLVSKPTFGSYQIQPDAIALLRMFSQYWTNSAIRQTKRLQKEEERQFSTNFLATFFHSN